MTGGGPVCWEVCDWRRTGVLMTAECWEVCDWRRTSVLGGV